MLADVDDAVKKARLINLRDLLEELFLDETYINSSTRKIVNASNPTEVFAAIGRIQALVRDIDVKQTKGAVRPDVKKDGADVGFLNILLNRFRDNKQMPDDGIKRLIGDDDKDGELVKLLSDKTLPTSTVVDLSTRLLRLLTTYRSNEEVSKRLSAIMSRPEIFERFITEMVPTGYIVGVTNDILNSDKWPSFKHRDVRDYVSSFASRPQLLIKKLLEEATSDTSPIGKIEKLNAIKNLLLNIYFRQEGRFSYANFEPLPVFAALAKVNAELASSEAPATAVDLPTDNDEKSYSKFDMDIVKEFMREGDASSNYYSQESTRNKLLEQFVEQGWLDQLINIGQEAKARKVIDIILERPNFYVLTTKQDNLLAATTSRLDYEGGRGTYKSKAVVHQGELLLAANVYQVLVSSDKFKLLSLPFPPKGGLVVYSDQDAVILNVEGLISPMEDYVDEEKAKDQLNRLKLILEYIISNKTLFTRTNMFDVYKALGRVNRIIDVVINNEPPIKYWEGEFDEGLRYYLVAQYEESRLNKADAQMLIDDGLLIKMLEDGKIGEAEQFMMGLIYFNTITSPKQRDLLAYIASTERQEAYQKAEKPFTVTANLIVSEARAEKIKNTIKGKVWPFTSGGLSQDIIIRDRKLPLQALFNDAENEKDSGRRILKFTMIRDILLSAYFTGLRFDITDPHVNCAKGNKLPLNIYNALGRVNELLEGVDVQEQDVASEPKPVTIVANPDKDKLLKELKDNLPLKGPISEITEDGRRDNGWPTQVVSKYKDYTLTLDLGYDGIGPFAFNARSTYSHTAGLNKRLSDINKLKEIRMRMPIYEIDGEFLIKYEFNTGTEDADAFSVSSSTEKEGKLLAGEARNNRDSKVYIGHYDEQGFMTLASKEWRYKGLATEIESVLFYPGGGREKALLKATSGFPFNILTLLELYSIDGEKVITLTRVSGGILEKNIFQVESSMFNGEVEINFTDPFDVEKVAKEALPYIQGKLTTLEARTFLKQTWSKDVVDDAINILRDTQASELPKGFIQKLIDQHLLDAIIEEERKVGGNAGELAAYSLIVVLNKNNKLDMTYEAKRGLKIKLQKIVANADVDDVAKPIVLHDLKDLSLDDLDLGTFRRATIDEDNADLEDYIETLLRRDHVSIFRSMIGQVVENNVDPELKAQTLGRMLALSVVLTYYITERRDFTRKVLPAFRVEDIQRLSWDVLRFGGEVIKKAQEFEGRSEGITEGFKLKSSLFDADKTVDRIRGKYRSF